MEKFKKIKRKTYYQISGWMIIDYNLKGNELIIFAIIYGFSQDGESCFKGTTSYLCELGNMSKRTVQVTLKSLVEKGLLRKIKKVINQVTFYDYQAIINDNVEVCTPHAESAPHNNKDNNIKDNIPHTPKMGERDLIFFISLFKEKFKTDFIITDDRDNKRQISALQKLRKLRAGGGGDFENFLKACFNISDSWLLSKISPVEILKNINRFISMVEAPSTGFSYLTYEQVQNRRSNMADNPFKDFARVKHNGGYVYVTHETLKQYNLTALQPGEK